MFSGGSDQADTFDAILEFSPASGQWRQVGRMVQARRSHALSLVHLEDVHQYWDCTAQAAASTQSLSWYFSLLMTLTRLHCSSLGP